MRDLASSSPARRSASSTLCVLGLLAIVIMTSISGCDDRLAACDPALQVLISNLSQLQEAVSNEATHGDGYTQEERSAVVALAIRVGYATDGLRLHRGPDAPPPDLRQVERVLASVEETRLAEHPALTAATAALGRGRAACTR